MDNESVRAQAKNLTQAGPITTRNFDLAFLFGGFAGAGLAALFVPSSWVRGDWIDRLAGGFCVGGAISFGVSGGFEMALKSINHKIQAE